MIGSRLFQRLRRDCSGAAAIELAFALPILSAFVFGGLWAALLGFSVSSLNFSVQSAARCAAVNAQACGTPSGLQSYAASRYAGPSIPLAYTASTAPCGHLVTGQGTFNLMLLPGFGALPISATACYP